MLCTYMRERERSGGCTKVIAAIAPMFTVSEKLIVTIIPTKFSLLLNSRLPHCVSNSLSNVIRATKSKVVGVIVTRNGHIKNSHQTFVTKRDRMRPLWCPSINMNVVLKEYNSHCYEQSYSEYKHNYPIKYRDNSLSLSLLYVYTVSVSVKGNCVWQESSICAWGYQVYVPISFP